MWELKVIEIITFVATSILGVTYSQTLVSVLCIYETAHRTWMHNMDSVAFTELINKWYFFGLKNYYEKNHPSGSKRTISQGVNALLFD
jgi:fumarate reductase subunit D